jgi:hypothetical protein
MEVKMKRIFFLLALVGLIVFASNVDPPQKFSVNHDMEQVSEFIPVMDAILPVAMETIYVPGYAEWSGGTLAIGKVNNDISINSFQNFNYYNTLNGEITRLNRQTCSMTYSGCLNRYVEPIKPVARSGTFYNETIA